MCQWSSVNDSAIENSMIYYVCYRVLNKIFNQSISQYIERAKDIKLSENERSGHPGVDQQTPHLLKSQAGSTAEAPVGLMS